MDSVLDDQVADSSLISLLGNVKANALDLTMDAEDNQQKGASCEGEDGAEIVQQGSCVLVLPVNQPGDGTSGNMDVDYVARIKCEAAEGHVIAALQDGTPVSIAGSLTDNLATGTNSIPTDTTGTVQLTAGATIAQQLSVKTVAEIQAASGGGDQAESSPSDVAFMMESSAKSGTFDPVTQSWFTSKHTKDNLSEQGHKWKQGMWSKEEVDILESNIEEYLKLHSITDANEVIFEMNKEERKDFYRYIAKDLQRPLFAVYRRVIRMYDQKNHVGKYSKEDIEKLKQLREKHGNDWALIGSEMGRSASSVKDKFRLLKERCHQGKWDLDEENLLASAVYELSNAQPGESITTGISWAQVAERVSTRTEKQCRAKWLNYLNWKEQGGSEWSKEDDAKLVERILATEAEEERLLNWEDLAKDWSSVRSPQWLRSKWWSIKRNVIGNESLSLHATIECLKTFPKRLHTRVMRQPQPQHQRIKLARVELPALADVRGATATLTVRVPIQLDQSGSTTVTLDSSDVEQPSTSSLGNIQELELLQTSVSGAQTNTYLITTPFTHKNVNTAQALPAGILTNRGGSSNQLILTAMRAEPLQSNENVTVQLNQNQHTYSIITSKPQPSPSTCSSSPLTDVTSIAPSITTTDLSTDTGLSVTHSHPDDIVNDNSHLATEIGHSDSNEDHSQSQLIGTDAVLSQQDIGSSDLAEVSSEPETTLVIVSSAPSSDLVQSSGSVEDTQLGGGVFTLTGPILQSQSDNGDLMIVDSDSCKDKLIDSPPDHNHDGVDS